MGQPAVQTNFVPKGDVTLYRSGALVRSWSAKTAASRGAKLLAAADAAATAGEGTIQVGPDDYEINETLLRNSVNWHFAPNSIVTHNGTGNGACWDDWTTGANEACTSIISGRGTFIRDGGATDDESKCPILLTNPSSNVTIECQNIEDNGDYSATVLHCAVRHVSGRLNINCNDILSPNSLGLWWSDGEEFINCNRLISRTLANYVSCCEVGTAGPGDIGNEYRSGYQWINARLIKTTTADANGNFLCGINGDKALTPRIWIFANEINGTDVGGVFNLGVYRWYIQAMKISNQHTSGYVVRQDSGEAWINCQKMQGGASGTINHGGGTGWYDILDLNDGGAQTGAHLVTVGADNGDGTGEGGTLNLSCQTLTKSSTGRAINVQGGTLNLLRGLITTSNASQKDLYKAANDSVLNVYPGVGYDITKTTGTITFPGSAAVFGLLTSLAAVTLTDGATPALNAALGRLFRLTAAGNRTIAVPTNPTDGQTIIIEHTASGGSRTLSLNTGTGGFAFTTEITSLTATSSGVTDRIGCIYNLAENKWRVVAYSKGT